MFQSALREQEGGFSVDDVIADISDKLIRRHPHIFANIGGVDTSAKVLAQWEEIKAAEKAAKADAGKRVLAGVPPGPALLRAQKMGNKAGKVGFDWPGWVGSLDKVKEEVIEVTEAAEGQDAAAAHHEIGDLLFAVVNLARKLEVDAETALLDACGRFRRRFEYIEDRLEAAGSSPKASPLEEMDDLWNQAKVALKNR